jgi:hypothetical protein
MQKAEHFEWPWIRILVYILRINQNLGQFLPKRQILIEETHLHIIFIQNSTTNITLHMSANRPTWSLRLVKNEKKNLRFLSLITPIFTTPPLISSYPSVHPDPVRTYSPGKTSCKFNFPMFTVFTLIYTKTAMANTIMLNHAHFLLSYLFYTSFCKPSWGSSNSICTAIFCLPISITLVNER